MTRPYDVGVTRLLNYAAWRYGPHKQANLDYEAGVLVRDGRLTVTMAGRHLGRVIPDHGPHRVRHYTRAVFIAWSRARPVGHLVITWCGHRLHTGRLVGHDTPGRNDCLACAVRLGLPAIAVHVNVHLATTGATP